MEIISFSNISRMAPNYHMFNGELVNSHLKFNIKLLHCPVFNIHPGINEKESPKAPVLVPALGCRQHRHMAVKGEWTSLLPGPRQE